MIIYVVVFLKILLCYCFNNISMKVVTYHTNGSCTTFQRENVAHFEVVHYTTFRWGVVAYFRSCTTPVKLRNVLHQLCTTKIPLICPRNCVTYCICTYTHMYKYLNLVLIARILIKLSKVST